MKQILLILALLLPAFNLPASDYQLQQVEDGDTLVLQIEGKPVRLQLQGIDAPEDVENPKLKRDQQRTGLPQRELLQLGSEATRHLRGLAHPGDRIRVEGDLQRKDKYGRIPVIAYASSGRSLNEAMVEDGYAIPLGRYPLDKAFKARINQLAEFARTGSYGLWGSAPRVMAAWSGIKP